MTLFEIVADERRGLAKVIGQLTEQQLQTPSLVPTWSVKDVAAHLTMAWEISGPRFLWTFLKHRGFDKAADELTWRLARRPASELAQSLHDHAESRFTPPGAGPEAPLTELLVHGLDLRRPLGIERGLPEDRVRICLAFLTETPARGFVRPAWKDGLRYEAVDLAWSYGQGPVLRGHSDDLLLALTGRRAALAKLEGDGVAALGKRYG